MRPKVIALVSVATIISLLACGPSRVEAAEFTVGIGAGVAPDYEGSEDYEFVPMWNLKASDLWGKPTYVQVMNTKLRSNFLNSPNLRLGLSGEYIAERDNVDNDQVDQLRAGDASALIGALLGYDIPLGNGTAFGIEVDGRVDVANGNGYLITPAVVYTTPLGASWTMNARLSTTWASEDYMSNYFGISNADAARSGLDQFDADAGVKDVSLELTANWRLNTRWSLTALGRYKRLLSDAADSPVTDDVGDENQLSAGVLVNLHF